MRLAARSTWMTWTTSCDFLYAFLCDFFHDIMLLEAFRLL